MTDLRQLVGLQYFRDRHRKTQGLTQVCLFLFQSHQAATEQILIHLTGQKQKTKWHCGFNSNSAFSHPILIVLCLLSSVHGTYINIELYLSKGQRGFALIILGQR